MPKNKGAGGKNRRKGKDTTANREIVYKIFGQEYGQITKSLGNGFMEIVCFTADGNVVTRAHIRGKMRKRVWMAVLENICICIQIHIFSNVLRSKIFYAQHRKASLKYM